MSYSDSEFSLCNTHFFQLSFVNHLIYSGADFEGHLCYTCSIFQVRAGLQRCRQGCHPWLKQACPRDGRSAICDCWETCPLCEKPSCSAFDFTFIIQHICSYLVKPALIWKKRQNFCIWKILASGSCLGRCATIIIRDTLFDVNISAALLSPYMDLWLFSVENNV